MAMFLVLYLALFLPATPAFAELTHWCWHTVLPLLTTHLGLEGHRVGDAATILPGLLVMTSLLSVVFAELCRGIGRLTPRCARAMRELAFLLERDADQWALRRRHDRLALASAICKAAGLRHTSSPSVTPLSGDGTKERLGQLLEDQPLRRSPVVAALLNTLAVVMVCATFLMAALVPSTALAGAQQLGQDQQVRHCED